MQCESEIKKVMINILESVQRKKWNQMDCFFLPDAQAVISKIGECGSWPLIKNTLQSIASHLEHIHIDLGNYFETVKENWAELSAGILVKYEDDTGGKSGIAATVLLKMIRLEECWKISKLRSVGYDTGGTMCSWLA